MNGLRFKRGEQAIYVFARGPDGVRFQGQVVEVVDVGPWQAGDRWRETNAHFRYNSDYVIVTETGFHGQCLDVQLRKLDSPAESESITRREEVEA